MHSKNKLVLKLTATEKETLQLIWEELNTKEIADYANISPKSVETRMRNLYVKIGCKHNRVSLIKWALREGYVSL